MHWGHCTIIASCGCSAVEMETLVDGSSPKATLHDLLFVSTTMYISISMLKTSTKRFRTITDSDTENHTWECWNYSKHRLQSRNYYVLRKQGISSQLCFMLTKQSIPTCHKATNIIYGTNNFGTALTTGSKTQYGIWEALETLMVTQLLPHVILVHCSSLHWNPANR